MPHLIAVNGNGENGNGELTGSAFDPSQTGFIPDPGFVPGVTQIIVEPADDPDPDPVTFVPVEVEPSGIEVEPAVNGGDFDGDPLGIEVEPSLANGEGSETMAELEAVSDGTQLPNGFAAGVGEQAFAGGSGGAGQGGSVGVNVEGTPQQTPVRQAGLAAGALGLGLAAVVGVVVFAVSRGKR